MIDDGGGSGNARTIDYAFRRLVNDRVLAGEQIMFDAPWHIRASDLLTEAVEVALIGRSSARFAAAIEGLTMFIEDSKTRIAVE